ncbi:unnamed protein product [Caenorhabditis sp. 36 PRJEB53466]|nr:unnamed protein product [Caenorhabditis sp. 36 PRJEB53466]
MADPTFAEHVANTNSRLASIKASLIDALTFPEACAELTKWCSDQRAFTAHFEENLMLALQVAMENGTKENYDFNLTHGLVTACFSHRKHLSKPSATRIGRWYEQMRRLKKNGGKRKRAPPKPKEPPITAAAPTVPPVNGSLPPLTSPCPPPPPPPSSSNGQSAENNNFMISPSSDGSMWPQGGPMGAPGSSAHMPPGAQFPGPMNPGMHSYPGQMPLPYGQMEGNHAMYDQRMMAARAGGRPNMMPDYPQMPMGQHPGNQMMRMHVQYPGQPGQHQMPAHHQMQYGQMMRAPPVSVYGQMNQPQPYPVTAHPNPAPAPFVAQDVRVMYETTYAYKVERELFEECAIPPGNTGVEAEVTHEAFQLLESEGYDVILSVWRGTKGTHDVAFSVYVNEHLVLNHTSDNKAVSLKQFLRSGKNIIQFGYNSHDQSHRVACEFVTRKSMLDLRKMLFHRPDIPMIMGQQRYQLQVQASKKTNGMLVIPLNCSLTKKRMFTPVRHNDCKRALFDMGQMISQNKDKTRYFCSHCHNYFKFEDMVVDYCAFQVITQLPPGISDFIIDRHGQIRPGEHEKEETVKPKRGKKRAERNDDTTIKRIKSETMVRQDPGMFPDVHARSVQFSPMPTPGSVPPDWTRLQSPSFSMQSPNKIQLGPATPATPGMVFQNPASAGSMLNMSSPRQTTLMSAAHQLPMAAPVDSAATARSGSAPYTPESVKIDRWEAVFHIPNSELFVAGKECIMDCERLVAHYMYETKSVTFENIETSSMEEAPNHSQPENSQSMMAPGSSSSSSSTFTPPFDDIHLGNRRSH